MHGKKCKHIAMTMITDQTLSSSEKKRYDIFLRNCIPFECDDKNGFENEVGSDPIMLFIVMRMWTGFKIVKMVKKQVLSGRKLEDGLSRSLRLVLLDLLDKCHSRFWDGVHH